MEFAGGEIKHLNALSSNFLNFINISVKAFIAFIFNAENVLQKLFYHV